MPRKAAAQKSPQSEVFDADAARADFQPVLVKYHGKEYALGTSAYGLVAAPDLFANEDPEAKVGMKEMLDKLPECLALLSPELGQAVEEHGLGAGEELLLLRAITEVMNRVGTFRAA